LETMNTTICNIYLNATRQPLNSLQGPALRDQITPEDIFHMLKRLVTRTADLGHPISLEAPTGWKMLCGVDGLWSIELKWMQRMRRGASVNHSRVTRTIPQKPHFAETKVTPPMTQSTTCRRWQGSRIRIRVAAQFGRPIRIQGICRR
jgi:hypothetical protein